MPQFCFRAPNGVVRSRTTRTRDPGFTHATMENHPFVNEWQISGWQLGNLFASEKEANEWAKRWPDREIVVVPRLVETPAPKSLYERVSDLEEIVRAMRAAT